MNTNQPDSNPSQSSGPAFPGLLEEMTLEDLQAFDPEVVVLPLGSTEPHGPHLPMGTDNFQVTRSCRLAVEQANRQGARALLYPTLPITNNANMRKVPFALRVGIRTLMQMLLDIASQCYEDGIRKMVIVNGHGGNPATINAALREMAGMDRMPFACMTMGIPGDDYVSPIEHPSDHAGESETSRMLWIRPDLVREEKFANNPLGQLRVPTLAKTTFVRPWHLYLPETAGGETRASSAEKGRKLIEQGVVPGLAKLLVELSEAPYDDRFPYE